MVTAYIGLGSNLDDPVERVREAIDVLRGIGTVRAVSSFYRTKPWGKVDQPEFVNAVVSLDVLLEPRELLARLQGLEAKLGRESEERWGPRRIDFDLLTYGDRELESDDLTVPHPRMRERAFVLVPLAELDERYAPMRDALPPDELAGVVKIRV